MIEVGLSTSAKALLRTAKSDVPSAAARAKIWGGVSATAKVGAGVAAVGGASKLLVIGTMFGSAMTVGLAAVMLLIGGSRGGAQATGAPAAAIVLHASPPAAPLVEGPRKAAPTTAPGGAPSAATTRAKSVAPSRTPLVAALPSDASHHTIPTGAAAAAGMSHPGEPAAVSGTESDPLLEEASLVAEARGALARGDAAGALQRIRTAKGLPARQLQPEELSIEGQALGALGRPAAAAQAGVELRRQYPDHALAH